MFLALIVTQKLVTLAMPMKWRMHGTCSPVQGNDQAADSVYAGIVPLTADDIADQIVYAATRSVHDCSLIPSS